MSGFKNTGVPKNEGQHLQNVVKPAKFYGGPGKFGFKRASYLDETHSLATKENKKRIDNSWNRYWDMGKEYLVEKSPPNLVRTRFLQYLYPESIFITVMRHPIPVSLATQKWSKTTIHSLFKHWLICYNKYLSDARYLNQQYLFKYEDFVNNPIKIMKDISALAGENITHDKSIKIKKNINDKYFNKWENKYSASFFKQPYYQLLINEFQHKFKEFGYSLVGPEFCVSTD